MNADRIWAVLALLAAASLACGLPLAEPTATLNPTPTPDWTSDGSAALAQGDLEEAVRLFTAALEQDPGNSEATVGLATAFYYQARYENVLRLLQGEALVDSINRNIRALEMLGRASLALSFYETTVSTETELLEQAADAFDRWAVLAAGDPAPYAYQALVAHRLGQPASSSRYLSQADAAGEHAVACFLRAAQALEQERYEDAVDLNLRAWALLPADLPQGFEHIACAHDLALSYLNLEMYPETVEWGLAALRAGPPLYATNALVAFGYALDGQCDKAQPYVDRQVALYPDSLYPYQALRECATRRGDFAAALAAHREAVERGATDDWFWTLDLEGSESANGVTLELTRIDIYGRMIKVYQIIDNQSAVQMWQTGCTVQWPGGREEVSVGASDTQLAVGSSNWTTTLHEVTLSPGDWLRFTLHCMSAGVADPFFDISVETTIPEFEPGPTATPRPDQTREEEDR